MVQGFVLALIDAGMGQNQNMDVLHSKGYTKEQLKLIFQGHAEGNDVLLQAFEDISPANTVNS